VATELHQRLWVLLRLQRADLELDRLRAELESQSEPEEVADLRRRVADEEAALNQAEVHLEELTRRVRRQDHEVSSLADERRNLEGRLYGGGIGNLKDIEQAQRKIEGLKAREGRLEEEALTAMEELDELRPQADDRRGRLEEDRARLAAAEAESSRQRESLEQAAREATAARAEALAAAEESSAELLARYRELRPKKALGMAICVLEDGRCGGCRVSISTGIVSRVRVGQVLEYCENCGRMLCPPPPEASRSPGTG